MYQRQLVVLLSLTTFVGAVTCSTDAAEPHVPVIPGFVRFHADKSTPDVDGGRLLINELNCASCHADLKSLSGLSPRRAPVLTSVGSRIHRDYMATFIANPHQTKPGTTMPNLFGSMDEAQRKDAVDSLVEFLATTGSVSQMPPNRSGVKKGEALFHSVGCLACHDSRKPDAKHLPTSIPLVDIDRKYTVGSLVAFLRDPHAVRPSGRMPNLNLSDVEALQVASYFLQDVKVPANVKYSYYEGSWDELPDFSRLIPKTEGQAAGINISVREKNDGFALVFEGYLQIASDTNATVHLASDDGSRVVIDGEEVVIADGIHPHSGGRGKVKLAAGSHKVVVEYFEGGGEESLSVDIAFKRSPKQSLGSLLTLEPSTPTGAPEIAELDPAKVAKGRELFSSMGCAACHELTMDGQRLVSTLTSPAATPVGGCLSGDIGGVASKAPDFGLDARQRQAIIATLVSKQPASVDPKSAIAFTMETLNCYACHKRGEIGGPERDRDAAFVTTIPEMGDEGRVPPPLDGVGDKLNAKWLKHVMENGANDRPYMKTRMPKFGQKNVGEITEAFAKVDLKTEAPGVKFTEAAHRIQSSGRKMVGDKGGLACVKCHSFDKYKATGIQALDLTTMTNRLRKDWFQRYLVNPQNYRPGTRMPTGFPGGVSVLPDMLDGEPATQIAAIWDYLKLGKNAPLPAGLSGGLIELKPTTEPIIYRNFIAGLSPRGIAVGYPEKAHLAWDAEQFSIGLIWHGAFIDASKHWNGRGQGRQSPMGDHVMEMVKGQPFAKLESADSPWPTVEPRKAGYRFKGYRLDENGRPAFQYQFGAVTVNDHCVPKTGGSSDEYASFERTISLTSQTAEMLHFRVAVGDSIESLGDGRFLIDQAVTVGINTMPVVAKANVRQRDDGKYELIARAFFDDGKVNIVETIEW